MTLAVIGKTGQLASALADCAPDANFYSRSDLDLSAEPSIISEFIESIPRPGCVIIAAAYTDVDKAESEPELAYNINARAPGIIAAQCARRDIPIIYVSTDCVFDGSSKRAYVPEDITHPINFYGVSKREGERAVLDANSNAAIVRTSWVFNRTHSNFMTKMITLARTRPALRLVDDQIGRPIFAGDLARAILILAQSLIKGEARERDIFHIANGGTPLSRADFARAIFGHVGLNPEITNIPTSEFPTPAQRPLNSVLDISHFQQTFGHVMPDWKDGLTRALKDYNHET